MLKPQRCMTCSANAYSNETARHTVINTSWCLRFILSIQKRFTDMSGEVRIHTLWVVNPASGTVMRFPNHRLVHWPLLKNYWKTSSRDSHIHPICKMSTCRQCTISPEERRWIKPIINAPLTFNELVLHFQDKAVLKLPFPGGQFPLTRLSLSTGILSDTASVIELKSCFCIWKENVPEFAPVCCVHNHAALWRQN